MADPSRADLQAAVERIQRLSDEHWWALDPTCGLMRNRAWLGPGGDRFGADVLAHQRTLRECLVNAVESARAKLAALPERT